MIKNFALSVVVLLAALPVFAQTMGVGIPSGDQPMMAPNMGGGGESMAFSSEMERSNYLRGGVSVQATYNDNVFNSVPKEADESYTISPSIAFDMSRSRLHWNLNYSPGFSLYQKFTANNQVDQMFSTGLQYAMSPHVTLSFDDSLARTPSLSGVIDPGANGSNVLSSTVIVVPPQIDTFTNNDSGEITYQFRPNAMVGFGGNSGELYFLSDSPTLGLNDSTSKGATAFYTHRFNTKHYVGVNYAFDDIVEQPVNIETQVHSITSFYTFSPTRKISLTVFGGAQHANTEGAGFPALIAWTPTEGANVNLHGMHDSFIVGFSRKISAGGGLDGAAHSYAANASFRHQFTQHLSSTLQASYNKSTVLLPQGISSEGGNTFVFSGDMERSIGAHFSAQLGYSRVNQSYSSIAAVSSSPNVNRGWIMISYHFERPIGR